MRYDKTILFLEVQDGTYNETTGDYDDGEVIEHSVNASVTDTTAKTMNIVYGNIVEDSKTVRLLNHIQFPFNRIKIDDILYKVDSSRKLRTKQTLIVSQVQ